MKTGLLGALGLALALRAGAENPVPLDRGDRSVAVDLTAGQSIDQVHHRGFGEFVSPSVALGQPLSRRLEGLVVLQPALIVNQPTQQPPTRERQTVWAGLVDVGVRWYPAPRTWTWVPFVDLTAGVLGASHRVPARGTDFNFHAESGVGVLLPLGQQWHPYVAARWFHISNGNLGHRNPAWDFWSIGGGARLTIKP